MGEVVVGNVEGREEESSLHYLGVYKNKVSNNYYIVVLENLCITISVTETYWSHFISWREFLNKSEDMRIL